MKNARQPTSTRSFLLSIGHDWQLRNGGFCPRGKKLSRSCERKGFILGITSRPAVSRAYLRTSITYFGALRVHKITNSLKTMIFHLRILNGLSMRLRKKRTGRNIIEQKIFIFNDPLELSTNLDNPVYDSRILGRRGGSWLVRQETLAGLPRADKQTNQAAFEVPEETGNPGTRKYMTAVGQREHGQTDADHLHVHLHGANQHKHSNKAFRRAGQSFSSAS